MRSVTQIKKNTAIKELHVALVPKWSTIPNDDKDDLESGSGEDRLSFDSELKSNAENTTKTKMGISINGEADANNASTAGTASSAVISSHLNKGEKTLVDCDRTESEIIEDCDKVNGDTVTNSGDREAFMKSSSSHSGADTCDNVKPVVMSEVPKMKYFFERGDSLKEEEDESNKSGEVTEKQIDSYYSIKGVKRAHEPEVSYILQYHYFFF